MTRARPTQRPISDTTRGSFSGPSTTSARTKMIRISKNRPSNRSGAPLGLGLALLRDFGEFGVAPLGADLLGWGALLLLALVHRLLEPTHGVAEIGADGTQLLGAPDQEHDDENDQQLLVVKTHATHSTLSPRRAGKYLRIIGQMNRCGRLSSAQGGNCFTLRAQVASSQNVTGPSLTRATCMWAPNTPAETGA